MRYWTTAPGMRGSLGELTISWSRPCLLTRLEIFVKDLIFLQTIELLDPVFQKAILEEKIISLSFQDSD